MGATKVVPVPDPQRVERSMDFRLWTVVVLIAAWVAVVLAAEFSALRHASPLLLSLPFLFVIVVGAAAFFILESRLADRALRRKVATDLEEAKAESSRYRDLAERLKKDGVQPDEFERAFERADALRDAAERLSEAAAEVSEAAAEVSEADKPNVERRSTERSA